MSEMDWDRESLKNMLMGNNSIVEKIDIFVLFISLGQKQITELYHKSVR